MEIAILVARIIIMVLEGVVADVAASKVAGESGMNASKLWDTLPKRYK